MAQRVTQGGATRLTESADVRVTEDHAGGAERLAGREPLQLVDLHQDFCTRRYSLAPCTAAMNRSPFVYDFSGGALPPGVTLT